MKSVSSQLGLHTVHQMLARERLAPVVPPPRIPDSASVHYVSYNSSDSLLFSHREFVASANSHRMSLNNWLQMRGGARRLTWEAIPTGPQNMPTWTVRAFGARDL
jgi:hypothetical protein